jgi:thiosulfate/3-mercaptopyruvate sulfurtransferase
VQVETLFAPEGGPLPAERIRELVGAPDGAEVVAYCHSGSRSAIATLALRAAGYDARNYAGSWHEWSRHPELPLER